MLHIAWSPVYRYALPEGHRFPMVKYELLPEQLLYEGTVKQEHFFEPGMMDAASIQRTHTTTYWTNLLDQTLSQKEIRKIGFPMTRALVDRGRHISMGTLLCARHAMKHGVSINIAGGTHHAFADHGEGFCVFNDFAIAANILLAEGSVSQILIVDLDVHQGNGTACIFRDNPRVCTFSMHGAKNYPHRKEASDLDLALPDGLTDKPYLELLQKNLVPLIERVQPQIVFYLAGVDVLATDKLGRLGLSRQGCKERDRLVFRTCQSYNIPVAVSMGGGYSERLTDLIEAHANTYRVAQELYF
ncbi:MAG: histone deacetylase [Saprospiraceae bacterium]|nr:histone deacetylase [Saprospiraceae bacterium]